MCVCVVYCPVPCAYSQTNSAPGTILFSLVSLLYIYIFFCVCVFPRARDRANPLSFFTLSHMRLWVCVCVCMRARVYIHNAFNWVVSACITPGIMFAQRTHKKTGTHARYTLRPAVRTRSQINCSQTVANSPTKNPQPISRSGQTSLASFGARKKPN